MSKRLQDYYNWAMTLTDGEIVKEMDECTAFASKLVTADGQSGEISEKQIHDNNARMKALEHERDVRRKKKREGP